MIPHSWKNNYAWVWKPLVVEINPNLPVAFSQLIYHILGIHKDKTQSSLSDTMDSKIWVHTIKLRPKWKMDLKIRNHARVLQFSSLVYFNIQTRFILNLEKSDQCDFCTGLAIGWVGLSLVEHHGKQACVQLKPNPFFNWAQAWPRI